MTTELLGVDVGGVLIDRIKADGSDTSFFSERFLETPAVEDAFDMLVRLGRERFGQGICIVSKCGPRTEEKTRLWLAQHRLLDLLGLDEQALHFCRKRSDKAPICKQLKVTHFIDDRMDVLVHLKSVRYKILFGPQEEGVSAKGVVRAEDMEGCCGKVALRIRRMRTGDSVSSGLRLRLSATQCGEARGSIVLKDENAGKTVSPPKSDIALQSLHFGRRNSDATLAVLKVTKRTLHVGIVSLTKGVLNSAALRAC